MFASPPGDALSKCIKIGGSRDRLTGAIGSQDQIEHKRRRRASDAFGGRMPNAQNRSRLQIHYDSHVCLPMTIGFAFNTGWIFMS